MKKIMMSVVVVAMLIGMMSCSGIGPDMTPDITVKSVHIMETATDGYARGAIFHAEVFYSDGTSDNDVTITGDTSSFGNVTIVATSNVDTSISDSLDVTINDLTPETFMDSNNNVLTFDGTNYFINDGSSITGTYSIIGTTITFSSGFFTGNSDNFLDNIITLNGDDYHLQQ